VKKKMYVYIAESAVVSLASVHRTRGTESVGVRGKDRKIFASQLVRVLSHQRMAHRYFLHRSGLESSLQPASLAAR